MKHAHEKNNCSCNDSAALIIDRKSTSRIVAGLLLGAFFIFTAGYFFGKRSDAQEIILQTERTAFADQLSYALQSAYNPSRHTESTFEQKNDEAIVPESSSQEILKSQEPEISVAKSTDTTAQEKNTIHYMAHLFGGNKKSVSQFANRLHNKGINVLVRQRSSKTAQGKVIQWYQAVTEAFDDKNQLMTLIDTIKKIEKVKDVQIVSMKSSMNAEKKGNS